MPAARRKKGTASKAGASKKAGARTSSARSSRSTRSNGSAAARKTGTSKAKGRSSVRSGGSRSRKKGMVRQASQLSIAQRFVEADRLTMLMWAFVVVCGLVSMRLFIVQVLQHSFYEKLATNQHELVQQLLPERGEIYAKDKYADTGLTVLATNQTLYHVYLNPKQVDDPRLVAEVVSPILGLDPEVVVTRASKEDDLYEPLKHQVNEQQLEAVEKAIEESALNGVHWTEEEGRYYPEGTISGSITGFVGVVEDARVGQYGLEGYYQDELSGVVGSLSTELDASGRFIAVGDKSIVEAQDGDTLILTIDKNIQYKACTLLAEAVEARQAEQGTVIVMDPNTGAIMAMCNAPLYDPNKYSDVEDISYFTNDAVSDLYESGSVLKPLTMAAGVNEGVVTPYTTYEDTGQIEVADFTISNSDFESKGAHGTVDMVYVLQESLNTGAIWVANQVGDAKWYEYLQKFGFGEPTGIAIGAEYGGNISSVAKLQEVYTATSSYGHGMTVTPIQLVQAYGALANGGTMMKPYLVDQVVKTNGYQEITEPEAAGQPISPETARTLGAMLVRVIDEGHATHAQVDGYFMAGKTGTALVPKENGVGYDEFRHKDTFVGFGPVSDPQFVVLVKMDEPKDVRFAAASVAPIFGDLAAYLVNYLQIPPDRTGE